MKSLENESYVIYELIRLSPYIQVKPFLKFNFEAFRNGVLFSSIVGPQLTGLQLFVISSRHSRFQLLHAHKR